MEASKRERTNRFTRYFDLLSKQWRRFLSSEEWYRFKRIYFETTPIVLVTVIVEIIAGIELLRVSEFYLLLPGLLLITPGLMEARGNNVTSLAKRLGSSVHLGLVGWDLGINDEVRVNVIATIMISIIVSFALSIMAFLAAILFNMPHISFLGFLSIALLMSLLVGTFLTFLTVLVVLIAHKLGLDPDNVTIPVVATLGDILTVGSLYVVIKAVLKLDSFLHFL